MKSILMLAIIGSCCLVSAQPPDTTKSLHSTFEKVDGANVPEPVLNSFESSFAGVKSVRWEKHFHNENGTYIKYVASFIEGGIHSKARYKEDGSFLTSSKYYGHVKLPEIIKVGIRTNYTGFVPIGAEEIMTRNGKTYYRVRTRNGSSKLVLYFDEEGNEITKNNAPEALMEGENEGGN